MPQRLFPTPRKRLWRGEEKGSGGAGGGEHRGFRQLEAAPSRPGGLGRGHSPTPGRGRQKDVSAPSQSQDHGEQAEGPRRTEAEAEEEREVGKGGEEKPGGGKRRKTKKGTGTEGTWASGKQKGLGGEGQGESAARPRGGRREAEGEGRRRERDAGRGAELRAGSQSCELRGINARQLARLSTVFRAWPAEDRQSVSTGQGASAAQQVRPGARAALPEREGAAATLDSGIQGGPRAREGPAGPGVRVAGPRSGRREGLRAAMGDAPGRAGPGSSRRPKRTRFCFVLFLARYWEDFHSCTVTALTDCQEGAKDMWDKLRKESKNLNIQGSLFELCGSGNGAAGSLLPALPVLLVALSAALATWLSF